MATQTANLTAEARTQLGGRANKRLRESGKLPAVIYGHKEAVVTIALPKKETEKHIHHGAHLYDLSFDGKSEKVLIKEVQFDHLGIDVIHVDFARVSLDEKVEVTVPLTLKGTPKGEEEGAVLQQIMAELEIECLVTEIPDAIVHDVTEMGKDSVLHIGDLKLPPGVKALADEDQLVATVREIEEETAEEGAEGAAEPEVIGKKEDAAEGEAAAE